jgi:hypothetical protein
MKQLTILLLALFGTTLLHANEERNHVPAVELASVPIPRVLPRIAQAEDWQAHWREIFGPQTGRTGAAWDIARTLPEVDAATAQRLTLAVRAYRTGEHDPAKARELIQQLAEAYRGQGLRAAEVFGVAKGFGPEFFYELRNVAREQAHRLFQDISSPRPPTEPELQGFADFLSRHPGLPRKDTGDVNRHLFAQYLTKLSPYDRERLADRLPPEMRAGLKALHESVAPSLAMGTPGSGGGGGGAGGNSGAQNSATYPYAEGAGDWGGGGGISGGGSGSGGEGAGGSTFLYASSSTTLVLPQAAEATTTTGVGEALGARVETFQPLPGGPVIPVNGYAIPAEMLQRLRP